MGVVICDERRRIGISRQPREQFKHFGSVWGAVQSSRLNAPEYSTIAWS